MSLTQKLDYAESLANDLEKRGEVFSASLVRRLVEQRAELLVACKAILGIDNPPAGEPGHIDFGQAIGMAQAAVTKAG